MSHRLLNGCHARGLSILLGYLLGVMGAPRWYIGARAFRALVLTLEIPFPYLPLYTLPYHDFVFPMADDAPTNVAGFTNVVSGTVQSILREIRLARLVASIGGPYLLEGKEPFSPASSPFISGTGSRSTPPSGRRDHKAEMFPASVITDPDASATKTSQGGYVAVDTVHMSKKRKRVTTKKTSGKVAAPVGNQ
ncbi:hypothetical protein LIER_33899 [Lithospermum erythrorhizon]|uniref:Uncharacterized protein n=1 Tax=Lithospermum erythrorhizon TaxID=34254 RepID=A0AAV3S3C6_LITER